MGLSYGSKIVLRAHNGRMVSVRLDNNALEAVSMSISDRSEFTLVGSAGFASGVVHDRDVIALRTFQGYVEAEDGASPVQCTFSLALLSGFGECRAHLCMHSN